MSISEGNSDSAFDLIWDPKYKYYTIEPATLTPKTGVYYTLRGLANAKLNEPDVVVTIPNQQAVDSIDVTYQGKELIDGRKIHTVDVDLRIANPIKKPAYYHLVPRIEGVPSILATFGDTPSPYKRLKHTAGFLVDHSRISNNRMKFTLQFESEELPSTLLIDLMNTTSTYYYFNKYRSDNIQDVNTSYVTPAIIGDGLNIVTSKAFGSFSALTSITYSVRIK